MKPRFTLVIIFCFVALFLCRAQELAALRPWLAFDRYEQYKASFYSGAGKLSALPGGGIQLTGEAHSMILRDRKFTIGRYQRRRRRCSITDCRPVRLSRWFSPERRTGNRSAPPRWSFRREENRRV